MQQPESQLQRLSLRSFPSDFSPGSGVAMTAGTARHRQLQNNRHKGNEGYLFCLSDSASQQLRGKERGGSLMSSMRRKPPLATTLSRRDEATGRLPTDALRERLSFAGYRLPVTAATGPVIEGEFLFAHGKFRAGSSKSAAPFSARSHCFPVHPRPASARRGKVSTHSLRTA